MARALWVTGQAPGDHSVGVTARADVGPLSHAAPARAAASFDAVYEDYFDLVWRNLRRLGVAEAAVDDALQDVFVVVHRRLEAFEHRSSLKTWIFGIALRVASEYVRRGRRTARTLALDPELTDKGLDPHEQHAQREAVELLYRVLDELDADKRAAFVLAELEEMSLGEIAAALDVNVNTVSSRVQAARRQFESALRRMRAKDDWRLRP
jgi:RNA polymerase sigma-70 factor (ECF subfamily)